MREHEFKKMKLVPSEGHEPVGAQPVLLFNQDGTPFVDSAGPLVLAADGYYYVMTNEDNYIGIYMGVDPTVPDFVLGERNYTWWDTDFFGAIRGVAPEYGHVFWTKNVNQDSVNSEDITWGVNGLGHIFQQSPDGTVWKIQVTNDGTLDISEVT